MLLLATTYREKSRLGHCDKMLEMATVSYLNRFLEPVAAAFTTDFARTIVELQIDPELQARVEVLRSKAKQGILTPEEDAEYKDFVESVDVISIIQAKARNFLAEKSS